MRNNVQLLVRTVKLRSWDGLRFTNKDLAFMKCQVSEQQGKRNAAGEWEPGPTSYYDTISFGWIAEVMAQLPTGSLIQIEARLKKEYYEKNDGTRAERTLLTIESLAFPVLSAEMIEVGDDGTVVLVNKRKHGDGGSKRQPVVPAGYQTFDESQTEPF